MACIDAPAGSVQETSTRIEFRRVAGGRYGALQCARLWSTEAKYERIGSHHPAITDQARANLETHSIAWENHAAGTRYKRA